MTNELFIDLVQRLRPRGDGIHPVQITEEEINNLTAEQAEELVALYGGSALMRLPEREQTFFSWLRREDEEIWNDLWGSDEDPYMVGLGLLTDLLPNRRGFLICDLVDHTNYYFTTEHISSENGSAVLDAALQIVRNEGKIEMYQAFLVEIWRAPIDQWRFAYIYRQPLAEVKEMVQWMISEEILIQPQVEEESEHGNIDQESDSL